MNVYSGFEKKVVKLISDEAEKKNLKNFFSQLIVPEQSIIEIKNGKKIAKDKSFFPGYILVKMFLNDDTWHLVKNISRVTGFLGSKDKPQPISEKEALAILKQIEESSSTPVHTVLYNIGDLVKVNDGPFASFTGVVEEIEYDKHRIKVAVTIFGRATPVDLDFSQVEKNNS